MSKVAFIGLGVMGYPMAGHLSKNYNTTVFNRNTEKSKKWTSYYNGKMELSIHNTVKDMGFEASHITDGFSGWVNEKGPIEFKSKK